MAQRIKYLPAMWETRVRSLGREDALEMEMAAHSSILGWRIPRTEEPGGLQPTGSQRVGHKNKNRKDKLIYSVNLSFQQDGFSEGCFCCSLFAFHIETWFPSEDLKWSILAPTDPHVHLLA